MMNNPIGFKYGAQEQSVAEEKPVAALEGDFVALLDDLDAEKKILNRELSLVKEIEHELVKIHKRLQHLEAEYEKRGKLIFLIKGSATTDPVKAASLVDQLFVLDASITEEYKRIERELKKHNLQDIHQVYSQEVLSADKIKHVSQIVQTLGHRLDAVGQNVVSYHANQHNYAMFKQQILQNKID